MNQRRMEEMLERYHGNLRPEYEAICAANGITDAPGVMWLSFISPSGHVRMCARILWNDEPPPDLDPLEIWRRPGPDDVVGQPERIAKKAAHLVISRLSSN